MKSSRTRQAEMPTIKDLRKLARRAWSDIDLLERRMSQGMHGPEFWEIHVWAGSGEVGLILSHPDRATARRMMAAALQAAIPVATMAGRRKR